VTIELNGQIVRKGFGTGTKSEHEGIYLVTSKGDYLLRRPGANPFELDPALEPLIGKQVSLAGTLDPNMKSTLFVSSWKVSNNL
jgi:hypothetical protein